MPGVPGCRAGPCRVSQGLKILSFLCMVEGSARYKLCDRSSQASGSVRVQSNLLRNRHPRRLMTSVLSSGAQMLLPPVRWLLLLLIRCLSWKNTWSSHRRPTRQMS